MENGKRSRAVNTRLVAEQNEDRVLLALHRFGWLRAVDLAAYLWPAGTAAGALRMAQRTLSRVVAKRYVGVIAQRLGTPAYGLTNSAAKHLEAEFKPVEKVRAADVKRDIERTFFHRSKANEVAIWWETKAGQRGKGRAWSEHELLHHRAPFSRRRDSQFVQGEKVPDGLLSLQPERAGGPVRLLWVEVENAYKRRLDHRILVAELAGIAGEYGTNWQPAHEYEVVGGVVYCPDAAHERRLAMGLNEYWLRCRQGGIESKFDWTKVGRNTYALRPGWSMLSVAAWFEENRTELPKGMPYCW